MSYEPLAFAAHNFLLIATLHSLQNLTVQFRNCTVQFQSIFCCTQSSHHCIVNTEQLLRYSPKVKNISTWLVGWSPTQNRCKTTKGLKNEKSKYET